ncbi:hypothetical protein BT69DRAFT_1292471 [Atractiella rhizophila]|nr:hypothetical protein BT69DRAFT_1292471 [Atractiella rhizophila]
MTCRNSLVTGTSGGLGHSQMNGIIVVKGDMTEEASMKAVFEEVKERVGGKGIDVLIANAGAIDVGGIKRGAEEMRREKFSNVPLQDFSELVNVGAIFDPLNNGDFAPYAVSKAALNMAARKSGTDIVSCNLYERCGFSDETSELKAPLEAPEAIEMLIKLVDKITLGDSGRFIDVPEDKDAAF